MKGKSIKFVQIKSHALFQTITKCSTWQYIEDFKKFSPPEQLGQFQLNMAQSSIWWKGFVISRHFSRGDISYFKPTCLQNHMAFFKCRWAMCPMGLFSLQYHCGIQQLFITTDNNNKWRNFSWYIRLISGIIFIFLRRRNYTLWISFGTRYVRF